MDRSSDERHPAAAHTWFSQQVVESPAGLWRSDLSSAAERTYGYDRAGRLTDVSDRPAGGGCTSRAYSYDANSNRLSRTVRAPASDGGCQATGTAPQQQNSFDAADRQVDSGFVYDGFGRQTAVPGAAAGGGALTQAYYVNDLLRSQTQDGQTNVWALDPARRQRSNTGAPDGSSERLHYADSSDSPAWSETVDAAGAQTGWSRNITGPGGELAATVTDSGQGPTVALQLANLRGDIIASASTDPAANAPTARYTNDEFANPQGPQRPDNYGFLGAKNRRTTLPTSGIVQMGLRTYIPNLGRFTTTDPTTGGSANNYDYTNQDPITTYDLDGRSSQPGYNCGGRRRCALLLQCMRNRRCRRENFPRWLLDTAKALNCFYKLFKTRGAAPSSCQRF